MCRMLPSIPWYFIIPLLVTVFQLRYICSNFNSWSGLWYFVSHHLLAHCFCISHSLRVLQCSYMAIEDPSILIIMSPWNHAILFNFLNIFTLYLWHTGINTIYLSNRWLQFLHSWRNTWLIVYRSYCLQS